MMYNIHLPEISFVKFWTWQNFKVLAIHGLMISNLHKFVAKILVLQCLECFACFCAAKTLQHKLREVLRDIEIFTRLYSELGLQRVDGIATGLTCLG